MIRIPSLLALVFLVSNLCLGQYSIESNLVGDYQLNSTDQALDFSTTLNHGTLSGGSFSNDRFDAAGEALSLDGTSGTITLSSDAGNSMTNEVTVSAWIWMNSTVDGTKTEVQYIVDRVGSSGGYALVITPEGFLRMSVNGGSARATSDISLYDNKWHHVAGTYSVASGKAVCFVDGDTAGTIDYSSAMTYGPNSRNNIAGSGPGTDFFEGKMDEVKIYDKALSHEDIMLLAHSANTGDLLADYPLSGSGIDVSGNNNNASLIGTPGTTSDHNETINEALQLNGSTDWLEVTANTSMSPENALSVSGIVRSNPTNDIRYIYDRLGGGGFGLVLTATGNARLSLNGGQIKATSTENYDESEWHCITGTYDKIRGEIKIYVDGELKDLVPYSSAINYDGTQRNGIGGPSPINKSTELPFSGSIAELKIWNRALTKYEVEDLCPAQIITNIENETAEKANVLYTFPNPVPAQGTVVISSSKQVKSIEIHSIQGESMGRTTVSNETLNLTPFNLTPGTYIIQGFNEEDNSIVTSKIEIK